MNKIALISRGVPGSGKSSLALELKLKAESKGLSISVHNTDDYFMVDGMYVFDREKLGYYHKLNFEAYIKSMDSGTDIVVCDNTNTKPKEYRQYVESASERGYRPVAVYFYPNSIEDHLKRNTHNVPREAIERFINNMKQNYQTEGVYIQKHFLCSNPESFNGLIDTVVNNVLETME